MACLPQPGGDAGNWGEILNDFLAQAHDAAGKLKNTGILASKYSKPASGIPVSDLEQGIKVTLDTVPQHTTALSAHGGDIAAVTTRLDGSLKPDGTLKDASVTRAALADDVAAAVNRADLRVAPGLQYPEHLKRWRTRLASARFDQVHVMAVGDSITAGAYASNLSSTDAAAQAVWRERSWAPQLRALYAGRFGDPGEGLILGSDPRVTNVGAANTVSLGVAGHGKVFDTTDTLTYELPACTEIGIRGWWNSGSDVFSYEVDGVGAVTTAPSSGDQLYSVVITGLSNTTHTLVLRHAGAGGKYSVISGVEAYQNTDRGVVVHRAGVSGAWLASFFQTTGSNLAKMCQPHFAGMDLAIIEFGTNDGNTPG